MAAKKLGNKSTIINSIKFICSVVKWRVDHIKCKWCKTEHIVIVIKNKDYVRCPGCGAL